MPKVPIPAVKESLEKYLASLKVVLPSSQYEQTKKTVEEFEKKDALKLQAKLEEYAKNSDNWVSIPFFPIIEHKKRRIRLSSYFI